MSIGLRSRIVLERHAAVIGATANAALSTMMRSEPLFHSATAAVAWAYETASRVPVKSAQVYAMGKPRVPSRLGLTPDEAHAQAALILSLVERVCDPIELAYVRARFGREFEALKRLHGAMLATLGTGVHSNRAVEKVILMYFGVSIGMKALQMDLKIGSKTTAWRWKRERFDFLDMLHRRTVGKLDENLRATGVVGD